MAELEKKIKAIRRRLILFRFIDSLSRLVLISLILAVIYLLTSRLIVLPTDPFVVTGGLLGGAFLVAAILTYIKRYSLVKAAVMADEQLGLSERLSSALLLKNWHDEAGAVEALEKDAMRHATAINPSKDFRYKPNRLMKHLVWPTLIFAAIYAFMPQFDLLAKEAPPEDPDKAEVSPSTRERMKKQAARDIRELSKEAKKAKEEAMVEEAGKFAKELERLADDVSVGTKDQKAALAELSRIEDELKLERRKLARENQPFKQISGLKRAEKTRELQQALKNQDFAKAAEQMQKLAAEKLQQMNAQDMQDTADELQDLAEELKENKQMAEAMQQAADALKQAAEEKKKEEQQQQQSQQQQGQQGQQSPQQQQQQNGQQGQQGQQQQQQGGSQQQQGGQQQQSQQASQQQQGSNPQQTGGQQGQQQQQQGSTSSANAQQQMQQAAQAMQNQQQLMQQMAQLDQLQQQINQTQSSMMNQQSQQGGQQQNGGQQGQSQQQQQQGGQQGQQGQGQQGQGQQPGQSDAGGEGQQGAQQEGQGQGQGQQQGQGQGQGQGEGQGQGQGQQGQGQGQGDWKQGDPNQQGQGSGGPGQGQGGEPPDAGLIDVDFTDEMIHGQKNKGEILAVIEVDAPAVRGESSVKYHQIYDTQAQKAADSMRQNEIPLGYRNAVKDYFEAINPNRRAGDE